MFLDVPSSLESSQWPIPESVLSPIGFPESLSGAKDHVIQESPGSEAVISGAQ